MRLGCMAMVVILGPSIGLADPASESPAHVRLDAKATPLLHGQLQISLPQGMKLERTDRVLSTGVKMSWTDEVRGTFEYGNARFELLAFETTASVGTTFRSNVLVDLNSQNVDVKRATIQKLALADQLVGFGVVPKVPPKTADASVLIYAAYLARANGTVQLLAFYLSANELPYARAWAALARRIATSATPGPRTIDLGAGEHKLTRMFHITTPADWMITMQTGTETGPLVVYQLGQVVPLGTKGPSCVLTFDNDDANEPRGTISGRILGTDITWSESADGDGPMTQAFATDVWRNYDLLATCRAQDTKQLPAMRKMVESLRAEP
jgi:hypothetical protein